MPAKKTTPQQSKKPRLSKAKMEPNKQALWDKAAQKEHDHFDEMLHRFEAPKTTLAAYKDYLKERCTARARRVQKMAIQGKTVFSRSAPINLIDSVGWAEVLRTTQPHAMTQERRAEFARLKHIVGTAEAAELRAKQRHEQALADHQKEIVRVISEAVLRADYSFFRLLIKELEIAEELAKTHAELEKVGSIVRPYVAVNAGLRKDNGWGQMEIRHAVESNFLKLERKFWRVRLPYFEELYNAVDSELVDKTQSKILDAIKALGLDGLPRKSSPKKKLQK